MITYLILSYVVPVKSKVKISQNFVAFSEYMNFKTRKSTKNRLSNFGLMEEIMDLARIFLPVIRKQYFENWIDFYEWTYSFQMCVDIGPPSNCVWQFVMGYKINFVLIQKIIV